MTTPKKILVTGACGYIGAALVRKLSTQVEGIVIRMLDNLSSGSFNALVDLPIEGHFQFVEADILDPTQLEYSLRDIDTVIHLAALVKTPLSFDNPSSLDQVNYWGTAHLVNACVEQGVENIIYLSSTSVYGPGENFTEDEEPKPLGTYANSKLSAENFIRKRSKDINYTILRLGTVYGPSSTLRVESFVNRLSFLAGTKKKMTVFGDGEQKRPVIYIDDCCALIREVLENPDDFSNQVYNAVEGNYSVNQVVSVIKELKGDVNIHYTDQDIRTHYSFSVDNEKLSQKGWRPDHDLQQGIRKLLDRFKGFEGIRLSQIDDFS
jgi:UDP-glucose 4-epimerase